MATSAYLISRAAVVSEVGGLALAITCVRLFAIARAGFRYLERLTSHAATFRILAHIRAWFYEAIEPLSPARLSRHHSGDLLARSVADVETLENFYIRVVVPPLASGLAIAVACVLLGAFSWTVGLALLVFLLLVGVALPLLMRRLGQRPAAAVIHTRARLNAKVVDEIQGVADLLVFGRTDGHRTDTLSLGKDLNRVQERMALLRGAGNALGVLGASLSVLAILLLAIPLVSGGDLNGTYLALLPLAAIASFEAVQPLAFAQQQLEANLAAGRRIFELIDAPPDVTEPSSPAQLPRETSISMREVGFRYGAAEPLILNSVSFSVPAGRRLAIVGPSGSGKSTILSLLLRFWEYQDGTITIGGRDLRDFSGEDARSLMGVMPQDIHLFNATVRDNLLLANPDATDEMLDAACGQALLHDFIENLPAGYDTLVGENGLLLSGGERQRLAIARVILKNAPIVMLDEPTANLDAETERNLMLSLEPFLTGRTVIVISHRRAAIEHADQIIHLENGRVVDRAVHPTGERLGSADSTRA